MFDSQFFNMCNTWMFLHELFYIYPPEVEHGVGDGWSSVFKRLNDDGETFGEKENKRLTMITWTKTVKRILNF